MDRQLWDTVREVFATILERPRDREGILKAQSSQVREEVEALLNSHQEAGDFLERDDQLVGGALIGPYRIQERVAKSGMSEVYRARREGVDFEQTVALKLMAGSVITAEAQRFFLREQRILAQFSHPNIVQLLDGGVAAGRRYFVMEWVDGLPVTQFCTDRALGLRAKLELFEKILHAVHHAHQQMVLHRDLKPSNILVTADAEPKVLDFGIAKILDSEATPGEVTKTTSSPMTLAYASPEQAQGQVSGVPTDVYALGLLLYELLSGRRAQPTEGLTLDRILRNIVEEQPPAMDPAIPRELELITAKAIDKDSRRRYSSALTFAQDIRRWLDGYPIEAREPTWGYVSRKFVRRHRLPVAVVAVALVLVTISVAGLVWEYRIAREQRALAERRFDAARKMARSAIFDTPRALTKIPGTLDAQKRIVEDASKYLRELAADSSHDTNLALDIAQSWAEIGRLQFNRSTSNSGDPAGAVTSQLERQRVLESVLAEDPGNLRATTMLVDTLSDLATAYQALNRTHEQHETVQNMLGLARTLAEKHPDDLRTKSSHATALYRAGTTFTYSDDERIAMLRHSVVLGESLYRISNNDEDARSLALAHKALASQFADLRNIADGLAEAEIALSLDQRRREQGASSPAIDMDLAFDYSTMGTALWFAGRQNDSFEYFQKSLAVRETLAAADPKDYRLRDRVAWMRANIGDLLNRAGRYADAIPYWRAALEMRRGSPGIDGGHLGHWQVAAGLARSLNALGQTREACSYWREALQVIRAGQGKPEEQAQLQVKTKSCQ